MFNRDINFSSATTSGFESEAEQINANILYSYLLHRPGGIRALYSCLEYDVYKGATENKQSMSNLK